MHGGQSEGARDFPDGRYTAAVSFAHQPRLPGVDVPFRPALLIVEFQCKLTT